MAAPALGCPRRLPHLPRLLLRRRPPGSSPGPVAGPGPGPGPGWAGASLEPPAEESPPAAPAPPPDWLAALRFDNLALRELPVEEPAEAPNAGPVPGGAAAAPVPDPAPRPVPGACFSRVRPTPLRGPRLVALSEPALALLGLAPGAGAGEAEPPAEAEAEAEAGGEAEARRAREAEVALYFSGNALPPGADPAAHCYCGHQFGSFAGQLGDGAAMYLGEVRGPGGRRWELQLKGAGPTPFSRAPC